MIEERNDALKINNKIAVQRYNFVVKCLGNRKRNIIDYGCGMGYGSYLLRQAGYKVIGVDNSKEAIDYAKENYPGKYLICDIEDKKLYNFQIGVCLEVLCHLKDPWEFVNNLLVEEFIVSAPIDPNPNDGYFYRLHNLSKEQFRNMFDDKKWKICDEFNQNNKYLTLYLKKIYE